MLFGGRGIEGTDVPSSFGLFEPTAVQLPLRLLVEDDQAKTLATTEIFGPLQVNMRPASYPHLQRDFSVCSPHHCGDECIRKFVSVYLYIYLPIYLYIYIYLYLYISIIGIASGMLVCLTYAYIYIYTYIYVLRHIYIYIFIYTHIYIITCMLCSGGCGSLEAIFVC